MTESIDIQTVLKRSNPRGKHKQNKHGVLTRFNRQDEVVIAITLNENRSETAMKCNKMQQDRV